MRVNDKEIAALAAKKEAVISGRLQYTQCRPGSAGSLKNANFRDRFFKLVGNLLFYYRISEVGIIDMSEPVGVIVLVNYSVQPESDVDISFGFALVFFDEPDKRHLFTARTELDVQLWVNNLQSASYQHWNDLYRQNQNRIRAIQSSVTMSLTDATSSKRSSQESTDDPNSNIQKSSHDPPLIALDPLVRLQPTSAPQTTIMIRPNEPVRRPERQRTNASSVDDDLIKF